MILGEVYRKHMPYFNFISIACPAHNAGNGRVYDPQAGAFLSPDPFVQDPYHTQSYNRYAYVFNNPMKYVEPSGYNAVLQNELRSDGVQWIINGAYNSDFARISQSFGASGTFNPYSYNWISGRYENPAGEEVPYWDFYNNYALPNAAAHRNYSTGEGFKGNKKFRFGYNYLPEKPNERYYWVRITGNRIASLGGDGKGLDIADGMLFNFSLTSTFISGVAESVKELSPVVKRGFSRTSKTIGATDLAVTIILANADGQISWGEKAKIGINGFLYAGTYNQYTLVPSIALGIAEEFGAFDSLYSNWDEAQGFYYDYGTTVIPLINPFTKMPIVLNNSSFAV